MIKINLLPQEMMGGKAAGPSPAGPNAGALLVALVLLILFGLNGAGAFFLFTQYSGAEAEYESIRTQAADVKRQLQDTELKYKDAKGSIERMQKLLKVAEQLDPADRVLWSRKLNMLPYLIPEGVYLTEIRVTQTVREKDSDESVKARNDWQKSTDKKKSPTPPPLVKIPVITQTLVLRGISYVPDGTGVQRLQQITDFYNNMMQKKVQVPFDKEPKSFMEGFIGRPNPSALLARTAEGREVSAFSFTITTKSTELR